MPDIVVVGEALIDMFAEPGAPLVDLPHFTPKLGGAPANVAAAVARLGGDVGLIAKVGADGFGKALRGHLKSIGVEVTHMSDAARPTMVACVALPEPDRPEFVLFAGANAELAPDDIDGTYLTSGRVMVFGSVTLGYRSRAAVLHAARLARNAGCEVVFDVNLRPAIWPDLEEARAAILEAIALSSAVKLNEDEARFLFGDVAIEAAAGRMLSAGPDFCCISRGAAGAYFARPGDAAHIAGFRVDIVDTTGCGDAFLAGLAVGLAEASTRIAALGHDDLCDLITFANACGAFVATELGAMDAPLTRHAAEALMKGTSP